MSRAAMWIEPRVPRRPYLAAFPAETPETEPPAEEHGAELGGLAQPRLLIVEDDWMIALQIESILVDAGYIVVGMAAAADEAISKAEAARPDLVLMDIRLQGSKDGIAAAIAIWEQFGIRSIYVTAHSDPGTIARGNAAAPAGWVEKPFTSQALLQTIEQALGRL